MVDFRIFSGSEDDWTFLRFSDSSDRQVALSTNGAGAFEFSRCLPMEKTLPSCLRRCSNEFIFFLVVSGAVSWPFTVVAYDDEIPEITLPAIQEETYWKPQRLESAQPFGMLYASESILTKGQDTSDCIEEIRDWISTGLVPGREGFDGHDYRTLEKAFPPLHPEGYWTPERLTSAEPIDMLYAYESILVEAHEDVDCVEVIAKWISVGMRNPMFDGQGHQALERALSPPDRDVYWTPQRLKSAQTIELPYASARVPTEDIDALEQVLSKDGASSMGSGELLAPAVGLDTLPGQS